MKILIIGTGYVGLTHGTCLAELGNEVVCIDVDEKKIHNLKNGILPIYEPGLKELVLKNVEEGRLKFDIMLDNYLNNSEIVFIAVGTPAGLDWHADLQYVKKVAETIGQHIKTYLVVVNKSTVPVGTGDMVKDLIQGQIQKRGINVDFDIVSNPEFLKEGSAIDDFTYADRIVIGCNNSNKKALNLLEKLYAPLKETKILKTDLYTAEIIKYGANSFLAMEISFINILAQLCEKVGADITKVSEGLKLDSRIGKKAFLTAGPGFGGSCFPKDVMEFNQTFKDFDLQNGILEATLLINEQQKKSIVKKVLSLVPDIKDKTISILGLAFKANTDDIRYSSSVILIEDLLKMGAKIKVFDPQAMENFKNFYPDLIYTNSIYNCVQDSDCFVVMTDRNEFKEPDWNRINTLVKQKNIVDARNIYNPKYMKDIGYMYTGIGVK